MGYKGSNAYVQRRIDYILRYTQAKAYCDDIVIVSTTFDEHVEQLRRVLEALRQANISIGPLISHVAWEQLIEEDNKGSG